MARKPRFYYPGALYHVILRGNSGQTIFFDESDHTRFCFLVQEGMERFGHRIHVFPSSCYDPTISLTLPISPLSRRTLMP